MKLFALIIEMFIFSSSALFFTSQLLNLKPGICWVHASIQIVNTYISLLSLTAANNKPETAWGLWTVDNRILIILVLTTSCILPFRLDLSVKSWWVIYMKWINEDKLHDSCDSNRSTGCLSLSDGGGCWYMTSHFWMSAGLWFRVCSSKRHSNSTSWSFALMYSAACKVLNMFQPERQYTNEDLPIPATF